MPPRGHRIRAVGQGATESAMAVCHQGSHAERLRLRKRLLCMVRGLDPVRGIGCEGNFREETEGPALVPGLLVRACKLERLRRMPSGLVVPARQQMDLAKIPEQQRVSPHQM